MSRAFEMASSRSVFSNRRCLLVSCVFIVIVFVLTTLPYSNSNVEYLKKSLERTGWKGPWVFTGPEQEGRVVEGDDFGEAGLFEEQESEEEMKEYLEAEKAAVSSGKPAVAEGKPSFGGEAKGNLPGHSLPPKEYYPSVPEGSQESSYRSYLSSSTSPLSHTTHSSTLTFSRIYVLSLPHRTDRRERMTKLASALGLQITFVDASVGDDDGLMGWIAERVKEVKDLKRPVLAEAMGIKPEKVGGMGVDSIWLTREGDAFYYGDAIVGPLRFGDSLQHDERWIVDGKQLTWVQYLESHPDPHSLKPRKKDMNVTEYLWDFKETNDFRQIRGNVIATWWSQTRVWQLMKALGDETALVLEDDVDLEWDIERIWGGIEAKLTGPFGDKNWEVVMLGHCWGREVTNPAKLHPLLHPSAEPRCLHGYALSKKGYNHLLDLYSDPLVAYTTAVDTLLPNLVRKNMIKSYSVEPSLIIQSKDISSDIQTGIGSPWRGVLMDSTLERIDRSEGKEIKDWSKYQDPATKFRPPEAALEATWAAKEAKKKQDKLWKEWRAKEEAARREREGRPVDDSSSFERRQERSFDFAKARGKGWRWAPDR